MAVGSHWSLVRVGWRQFKGKRDPGFPSPFSGISRAHSRAPLHLLAVSLARTRVAWPPCLSSRGLSFAGPSQDREPPKPHLGFVTKLALHHAHFCPTSAPV